MKIKSKWLAIFLIITLAMSLVMPGLAMADDDEDEVELRDVNKHWAQNNVVNLKGQGIINGYPDGTFRPNAPVSTAEAVVMAVKLLGLDEQAKAKADAQLPFTDAAAVPDWARGYVAVAVEKGLVDGAGRFQPNKKATRMDVTILLVKTLNAEIAIKNNNTTLKFTDINNVSQNDQQYIALAVLNDLIKGYDDKSFQPNKPVTRAEMATLFARLQDQIGSENGRINGKIMAVDASVSKITVATSAYIPDVTYAVYNEGSTSLRVYELAVATDTNIFRDNKAAALADLKAGDKVAVLLNKENVVVFVDAYSVYVESNIVEGQVKKIDAVNRTIRLYQYGIADVDYTVAQSAYITKDGAGVTLDKIVTGDWVKMEKDASGNIVKIEAKAYNSAINGYDKIKIEIEGPDFEIKMEQNKKGKAKVEIKYEAEDEDDDVYEDVYEEDDEDEIEDDSAIIVALDRDEDDEDEDEVKEDKYNKGNNKQDKHNKEQNKEQNKEKSKNQNKNVNGKQEIKLTGAEAAAFIEKFVAEAQIGETVNPDLIIAAVEKILGITVDNNKVEIEIEIEDGNREMEFEF